MNLLFARSVLREFYTDSLVNLASIDDMPPADMCFAHTLQSTQAEPARRVEDIQ
jgi:hypothetical protein